MKKEIRERIEKIGKGEVPEGFRKTKVGIIPDDWEVVNLKHSFLLKGRIGWQGLTTKEYLTNGDYYLITGTDFENGKINWKNCAYVSEDRYLQDKNIQIKTNDILVTKDGTIGKIAYISNVLKPTTLNSGVFVLRPLDGLYNPKWVYYLLESILFKKFIHSLKANSTISHLYQKDFENFKFIRGEIKEQEKIAEILSTWDKAIELKEKLITEKKEFKRGLMQRLLTGKVRFPEFTGVWKKVTIGDIFEKVKRINDNISNGIDILTISAKHGFISQKDKFSKIIAGNSLDKYTHLLQNEFAYNKGNSKTAPFGCIFKLDMKEGLVPFVYICFRPTQMIDVDFFNFYFKHGLIDRQLKKIITSGARGDGLLNVSKDDFFNIKIPSPSIEEQKKIGFVLRLIQNEIDYLIAELNQLKEQKRGLMQLLLTGIVRVEVD